ncbi:1-acyl-sn-glycerol-3-phosphate acyltransferase [Sphingomonas sp. ID1715]|uniref:lysophospholipid acyltransferase family protein n=1 Tax=Sphingomonas sp. ID1715 TaxID=1656898 RepID=UPI0020C38258|nr:lysophospholipid acyltransferase family protein [Sphingomonas sp. ID1715]
MRVLALVVALLFHVPAHLITRAAGRQSHWPRRFLARVAHICGADLEVKGEHLAKDVLFVSNHQSWLDIPIIAGATGTAFVANSGVRDWPVVGWLAGFNNTVYVDRADRAGVHGQVGAVRAALERHQPVAIFPEGTTARELLPFKPSLLEVVSPPPRAIRVQPLRLTFGAPELAWIGDEPALANIWRVLTHRRFRVLLEALEPFDPAAAGDRKAIAADARARIVAGSAWTPGSV